MTKQQIEREKKNGLSRLTIVLPKKDFIELKVYAAQRGVSMMEIVRLSISKLLSEKGKL